MPLRSLASFVAPLLLPLASGTPVGTAPSDLP